jgi:hypothetical protein
MEIRIMSETLPEDTFATSQLRIVLRESGVLLDAAQTRAPLYSMVLAGDKRAKGELEELDQIMKKMSVEKAAFNDANLRHDLVAARSRRDAFKKLEAELYDLLVEIRLTDRSSEE